MKKILFVILLLLPFSLMAQIKYDELVREMQTQSTNVAFYNYQKFQKQSPEIGNVYFQMGLISYEYLKNVNPIIDYNSFEYYAYNAKLYFESALHFADDAEIRKHAEFYKELSATGKKLKYEDLKNYIIPRLDTIKYLSKNGTILYENYSRLFFNYDRCISLFYQFNEKYSNVNEALLLVDNSDIEILKQLKVVSDSLDWNIEKYLEALKKYEIKGYNPQFFFYDIILYRVDGLCSVDFLKNKVILYDYSKWVDLFISKYERVNKLKNEIFEVYGDLLTRKQVAPSVSLVNALYQIDENSYPATMMSLLGLYNQSEQIKSEIVGSPDFDQKIYLAYKMSGMVDDSKNLLENLNQLSGDDYFKYSQFNQKYLGDQKPFDILKHYVDSIDTRYDDVLAYLQTEVDSLQENEQNLKEENPIIDNFDYVTMLNNSNIEILYVYRYQQNSSFVLYVLNGKVYLQKVIF
ncbi:MAG: hypothetical protein J6B65_03140 [Paludibacteraceae bacterium]|nr:hypothetical protein [Paludibacteraceae bacterium]